MPSPSFDKCGIALRRDVEAPECLALCREMEVEQQAFLAKQSLFRSPEYRWPHDALHSWSRIWEYPFVLHHLRRIRSEAGPDAILRAADIGSGVTFFPLMVARNGFAVSCVDLDPVVAKDLPRAAEVLGVQNISALTSDGGALPFPDSSMDVVYCVSVLEHIPAFEDTIREMARVLKPRGHLILTIDLDLNGNADIGPERYRDMMAVLESSFESGFPRSAIHPADMLTSANSRFPIYPRGLRLLGMILRQFAKPFFGRRPLPLWRASGRIHLAVEGSVWRLRG